MNRGGESDGVSKFADDIQADSTTRYPTHTCPRERRGSLVRAGAAWTADVCLSEFGEPLKQPAISPSPR